MICPVCKSKLKVIDKTNQGFDIYGCDECGYEEPLEIKSVELLEYINKGEIDASY